MRINMKHIVEIAGGLVLGGLASEALRGVANTTKNTVKKIKSKKKGTEQES